MTISEKQMEDWREGAKLRETWGFSPLEVGTMQRKGNLAERENQRIIVANFLSDLLDRKAYVTQDFLLDTVASAGRDIFRNSIPYQNGLELARPYLPRVATENKEWNYKGDFDPIEEDKSISTCWRDSAIVDAFNVPPRLRSAVPEEFCKRDGRIIYFKNLEKLYDQLREDYKEIYQAFGDFKDLREKI